MPDSSLALIEGSDAYLRAARRARRARERTEKQARRDARAIYELQMREAVIRWTHERVSDAEIARRLGNGIPTIKRYRRLALERAIKRAAFPPTPLPPPKPPKPPPRPRLPKPPPPSPDDLRWERTLERYRRWRKRMGYPVTTPDAEPTPPMLPVPVGASRPSENEASGGGRSGTVLDPPEIVQLRKDCLHLRKAALPFDQMADLLGISEQEARQRTAEAINELQQSEHLNADMHRTLMIEQIDQMIAAIHAPATGRTLGNERIPVVYDAIDRMMKLMKQKADLLGISDPPPLDIRLKLQQLAEEGSYDIVDLEDIARDVLQAHKLRLPEFR